MRDESWRPLGKVARLANFYCKARRRQKQNPPKAQEQFKKPQVQCNTLLIFLYREVWRPFGLFRGGISEQRSLITETDHDQPGTVRNTCKRTRLRNTKKRSDNIGQYNTQEIVDTPFEYILLSLDQRLTILYHPCIFLGWREYYLSQTKRNPLCDQQMSAYGDLKIGGKWIQVIQ